MSDDAVFYLLLGMVLLYITVLVLWLTLGGAR